jgi:predicted nucleic acid-binding protein
MASDPKYGRTAEGILSRIEKGEESAITSTLVITQVLSYLKWRKRSKAVPLFVEFLQSMPNLTKSEATFSDYVEIRKAQNVDWRNWDDLVIAAQMKRLGISKIYSNDADFDFIAVVERIFE